MDLEKADYFTIVQFGNKEQLFQKLKIRSQTFDQIKNIRQANGQSLLEKCLASRNFDIAKLLLDSHVHLNCISKAGYNELHYIAANINEPYAIKIGEILLERGVDINLKDKKFGNTPFWYLCNEALLRRNPELNDFILLCFQKKPDIDSPNKAGFTIRKMLEERSGLELLQMEREG